MITFKQFLNEAEEIISASGDDLKELLEHDCDYFLNESSQQGFLLRGMRNVGKNANVIQMASPADPTQTLKFWERNVRQDRSPSDTPLAMHLELDRWFDKTFSIRARSQALFCYGSSTRGAARVLDYGHPYIILPIGRFEYVWSPKVIDLYPKMMAKLFGVAVDAEMVDEILSAFDYKAKGLDRAVTDDKEIMVACHKYYVFDYEHRPILEKILGIE